MSKKLSSNPSLTVPFLLNDEEKAVASHPSAKNTVSFFRTCLNGLNAIAGFTPYNSCTYFTYLRDTYFNLLK